MNCTIKDLAKLTGVSTATVSLALRDDPRIARKTRQRVKDAAAKVGYVSNHFGRALQSQKSRLIGFLIPSATASFYDELIQAVGEIAVGEGYGVIVAITDESIESEKANLRLFREKRVDGMIVAHYHRESIADIQQFEGNGTPVVFCDFESFDPAIPHVRVDDAKATQIATRHLLDQGHRRFAYCFCRNPNSRDRYRVCAALLADGGYPAPALCDSPEDLAGLLKSDTAPTAIVAYSDLHAVEAKHVARDCGLTVPQDLSITGFDDMHFASWPEIDLTTIAQPKGDIGRESARSLIARIRKQPVQTRLLEPRLIVRGSTGPPKGNGS